ncbi:MAG: serine hydroxymethyltransferase [Candidatus Neomarinimicrobiota bacterium]
MNIDTVRKQDPELFAALEGELSRERNTLELIASENFTSRAVLEAAGTVLTNKYAEGYPGKRYYGGCEYVDQAEELARQRARKLFRCEYANVQPHSGSQANMGVYFTVLKPGDTMMGLDLAHGGHLTHGSPVNFSGKLYNIVSYGVSRETGRVDFAAVRRLAREHRPKLIVCGGSAYPRCIEFEQFQEVAGEVNALLLADIAHPAGLVATGYHPSPWPFCDFVTSTTHKTLRGPRGGLILMEEDRENPWGVIASKSGRVKRIGELLDGTLMPGIQGGPLMHIIAAKAVAFGEALKPEFKEYCGQIVRNAVQLAESFLELGYQLVSGGTDTHLILVDLSDRELSGKAAENALEAAGLTVNKNMVPFDQRSPMVTSGIRIGTPAVTTRGMKEEEMRRIAGLIDRVLRNPENEPTRSTVKREVQEMCRQFPLYQA